MIEQWVTAFIASAAFGIIFNVPSRTLWQCGIVGAIGWIFYFTLVQYEFDQVFATFFASVIVAFISHIFAKMYKTPMIIYSVAGIIPLVPGGLAYNAMRHIVLHDYTKAIEFASVAFMISGAIAMGLVFSEVLNQVFVKKERSMRHTKMGNPS
ncbi:threonine/serine exporter family protein [Bacillus kexueae]|uniref:threonine/serine exporter family protein n=1 Tax=Aeribacillus kexueae TaxID=2078952 RepID=UPI001FAF2287|nr:threonine/serine exporter family protein [Bacillus kexueae]